MKKIDYFAAILLMLLGSVHTILTPVFYEAFDLNALWFAGTGLAFIFLAFMNFSRLKTKDINIKLFSLFGNAIGFIYCFFIVLNLAEYQAYISLFDLLVLLIMSSVHLRSMPQSE